jgi:ATP-binding cassette subfamily B protein
MAKKPAIIWKDFYSKLIWIFKFLLFSLKEIYLAGPKAFLLTLAIAFVSGIFPAIFIKATSNIIQALSDKSLNPGSLLYFNLGLWAIAILGQNLLSPVTTYLQSVLGDKITHHINLRLIKKANSFAAIEVFDNEEFYNNLELIRKESYHKPVNMTVTLVGIFKDFVIICSCLFLLREALGWKIVLMLICAAVNSFIFVKIQNLAWQDSFNRSTKSRFINYLSTLVISPKFIKEIRFFGYDKHIENLYNQSSRKLYLESQKNKKTIVFQAILPLCLTVGIIIFLTFSVTNKIALGAMKVGAISVLIQSILQLQTAVDVFGEQAGWLRGHLLFFEKYFEFINVRANKTINNCDSEFELPITVEFKDVSFSYYSKSHNSSKALSNINFVIRPYDKIAIVGANGAGKSTFIKLLCGLYLPSGGEILINGLDIRKINLAKWRQKLSPVFQDFCSYDFTLKENISCIDSDKTRLKATMKKSEIAYLAAMLDAKVGKAFGGIELSGGQWQKVVIARALHNKGEIFILDEPTAALDPISEYEIFKKFEEIAQGKTVIFVTHRLNSVIMADKVMFMDNGSIIDYDTHSELMRRCKKYKEMFDKQAEGFIKLAGTV